MRTRRLFGMIDSRANCENSPLGIFLVEKMSFENRGSQLQASLGEKRKDMSTLFAHVAWRILSCHWQNLLWESTCWANSFSHSSRFARCMSSSLLFVGKYYDRNLLISSPPSRARWETSSFRLEIYIIRRRSLCRLSFFNNIFLCRENAAIIRVVVFEF